ncbi:sialate O-acetylesterase [Agriterribacter sp.]|uniref:sialate O-acetylesterase n=1 Tax=Agriterribacter sp. TaxID=2821509 RepID=UPI002CC98A54|nr:sialate O-acetylesterase [Agriterribacter sp.]HTN05559.1 sialate O-acetylesterase [Agriterribacter sp.]
MNIRLICFSLLSFIFMSVCPGAFANIRLPAVLSDNMVLQQQSTVKLWGWSSPGEKIFITTSWSTMIDSTIASGDAKWNMAVKTPAAGGPYTITFKGSNTVVLSNVMIGEVWVCSGQSNMEWSSLNGLPQIDAELPNSANINIRFFHIPKTTALTPQEDCAATWKECNPETLKGFSAVAYYFGKQLQQQLNVPVGLINTSWGGTPAEVWTPEQLVENDPELKAAAAKIGTTNWWPNAPGRAYNAMIAPITSFNIAGAIWYQGESNAATASTYKQLMTTLIDSWRKDWKKDFPFYYVQIAPFAYGNKNIGALLREAQAQTLTHPNTGMAVITDLVDDVKNIHPHNKKDVGARLAAWALAETYYKEDFPYKSPVYRNMEVNKNKVTVYFDNAPKGLIIKEGEKKATEFYIAGDDQHFLPADVKIDGDHVILSNKQIKNPVAVRFAFSNTAIANIFSKEAGPGGQGLPVTPFRTDKWEVDTGKVE